MFVWHIHLSVATRIAKPILSSDSDSDRRELDDDRKKTIAIEYDRHRCIRTAQFYNRNCLLHCRASTHYNSFVWLKTNFINVIIEKLKINTRQPVCRSGVQNLIHLIALIEPNRIRADYNFSRKAANRWIWIEAGYLNAIAYKKGRRSHWQIKLQRNILNRFIVDCLMFSNYFDRRYTL